MSKLKNKVFWFRIDGPDKRLPATADIAAPDEDLARSALGAMLNSFCEYYKIEAHPEDYTIELERVV